MNPSETLSPGAAPREALLFDVFGTLVDWRRGVAREAEAVLAPLGLQADWGGFADAWRAQYQPAMQRVRSGARPFIALDELHREELDRLLAERGWAAQVDEAARQQLTLAWHRLDAWADVGPALARLRSRYWLAPCSNGPLRLMASLARRNGWHWDAVLGAEWARAYKPDAWVYQSACMAWDLEPAQVTMVAAHPSDLDAAAALGLRTAYVARPQEFGPAGGDGAPERPDWAAGDLGSLADQLLAAPR